jgi:hypothetical protein
MGEQAMRDSLILGFIIWLTLEKNLTITTDRFSDRVIRIIVEHEVDFQFNLDESDDLIQDRITEYRQLVEETF